MDKRIILFWITILCLAMPFAACRPEKPPETPEKQPAPAENAVSLTVAQYQMAGIRLGGVELQNLSNTLKVNGKLDVPPQNTVSISPPMGGFLKNTSLLPGMRVKKGQVVAILENPDFIQLQQDYLENKSQLEFLAAEYVRQQELSKENVNALKTLQQAKAQYHGTLARVSGLKARLRLLHLNPARLENGTIRSTINLYAPINGYVTQVNATIGSFVNPADVLFQIVNPDHIHAELSVFEKDIAGIRVGQKVRFMLASETRERTATVYLIHKEIAADRSVGIHCHLDREDPDLLPGTYLKAWIEMNRQSVSALPETAVINAGEENYIFALRNKDSQRMGFERIAIKTGLRGNGFVQVDLPGNIQDNTIVTKGAYDLLAKMTNAGEE